MIFLTGDVHNMSLNVRHQSYLPQTELVAAEKYLSIAEAFGINVTLFISGKSLVEEPWNAENLLKHSNLEIGGHTWDSFARKKIHRISTWIYGTQYGPKFYQDWDIQKTVNQIKKTPGADDHELSCFFRSRAACSSPGKHRPGETTAGRYA